MPEDKPSKQKVFSSRLFSTVLLWAIVFLAFYLSSPVFFLFISLIVVAGGLLEYFGLFSREGDRRFQWIVVSLGILHMLLLFAPHLGVGIISPGQIDSLMLSLLLFVLFVWRMRTELDGENSLREIAASFFGYFYIVILFGFLPRIVFLPLPADGASPPGQFYLLYLVAIAKFTDMGAYLIGSLIGKHKMIPHISPGKTWQGFGGAILFALIAAFGFLYLLDEKIALITPGHALALGIIVAILAVTGDLCESIIKRSLSAKDSGKVMPGIGGILDLFDSILLSAPAFYLYLLLLNH